MAFEVFDKRQSPLAKAPTVTIQRRGLMSMNRAAYNLIGAPTAVELLYDREADVIGFRPAKDDVPHAYSVRSQSDKETGPVAIAGTAFCQFYKINTEVSRRWTPTVSDGILRVDLTQAGTKIIGNRALAASRRAELAACEDVD